MRTFPRALTEALAAQHGLLRRRDHPELDGTIAWLARAGRLVRVLPGIYCEPGWEQDWNTRIRAAQMWCPDGVLTGAAAAKVTFWPAVKIGEVVIANRAHRRRLVYSAPGVRIVEREVPVDLWTEEQGLRVVEPALAALELCDTLGGDAIDTALRTKATTLARLEEVMGLIGYHPGNRLRRRLLLESRNQPWSALERRAHALLHEAGITGWNGNTCVETPSGAYWLDIAFPAVKLAVELDGWEHHQTFDAFQSDRSRQNWLVRNGWRVLRFTWQMLILSPEAVVQTIRETLVLCGQNR